MKFLVLAAVITVVAADSAYPAYPKEYEYPPRPYNFAYAVKDYPSYNDFGHQEVSDGKVVSGSYNVLLPDGRTQTVTYKDDGYSGYVADVKYTGEAKAYDYKPSYTPKAHPAPSYPAPAYPTPSYPTPAYPAPTPVYPAKYP